MAGDSFHIRQQPHDTLLYDEENGRSIEFNCPSQLDPPQVTVPAENFWPVKCPAWACERRSLIVARLRAADCVVFEAGDQVRTVLFPDPRFRVEFLSEIDERGPAYETIRVIRLADEKVTTNLPLFELFGPVRFPSPTVVDLPLRHRYGQQRRVIIDVISETFSIPPDEQAFPLNRLFESINPEPAAALPYRSRCRNARPPRVTDIAASVLSVLFVAAAIFVGCTAKTTKDRAMAVACGIFFGFCASVPLWTRRGR